jgi:hypothetical protein
VDTNTHLFIASALHTITMTPTSINTTTPSTMMTQAITFTTDSTNPIIPPTHKRMSIMTISTTVIRLGISTSPNTIMLTITMDILVNLLTTLLTTLTTLLTTLTTLLTLLMFHQSRWNMVMATTATTTPTMMDIATYNTLVIIMTTSHRPTIRPITNKS